nr:amino acid adenylation domain-containing protein [Chloroflexota bacterium]
MINKQQLAGEQTPPSSMESVALPLLTPTEYNQIVVEWNATARDYPYERSLAQCIEAQVERTPDAPAVVFEEQQLTYQELNKRANQLAHHLQSLGVGPDVIVSVSMERSLEMVIALVGILKAGGAYVPLDPTLPLERLAFMLEDLKAGTNGQASVLLTLACVVAHLPVYDAHVICLDTDWEQIASSACENPVCTTTPDHLAYVIYTSGSTGKPKGAMNTQRGICNRLLWMQEAYQLTAADSVLQKTPFSFDVSVWEFFWPLMTGARLVVAQPGGHKDSAYLISLMQQQNITTLHFVPSMLQIFLEEPGLEACTNLRQVICSGEALPYALQERFFARHPTAALYNLYGPTEAAIDVTHWHCQRQSQQRNVPIGYPIANTQLYILNHYGQPVPIGVTGELYIGGVGVARGYLNRPELTAERFVHDPFTTRPGAHLYRTGDLARYLPDGAIEYLGRSDHQIKLRGFRVELGEIETVLSQHPAVREAVVTIYTHATGDQRLAAYVVLQRGQEIPLSVLQEHLSRQVPDYMVPAAFIRMEALPLNSSGKVDRRALLPPVDERPELPESFVAPHTSAEETIVATWTECLGVKQVGIHDNFFALGGHSLLAMQVTLRLRKIFQVDLSLRDFFDAPTVAQFAQLVMQRTTGKPARALPAMRILARESQQLSSPPLAMPTEVVVLPMSFAQQRLWFLDQMSPQNAAYNIPTTIHRNTTLDLEALQRSLQMIVQRHEVLRTAFALVDGQPRQILTPMPDLPLVMVNLEHMPAIERQVRAQHLLSEEAARPFDLVRGPLFRLTLLRLDEREHILILMMHHSISDGWSVNLFFQELITLYEALSTGHASPLLDLPVQYADFSEWQHALVQGALLAEQLAYWKHQLAGAPKVLELPADRPRPAIRTPRGATYSFTVSRALTMALKAFSQQEGITLYITLVAAFQALLYRYTGQDDLVIGTAIADRELTEVQGLLGLFLNTLALRTNFADNPTVRTLLQRVRDVILDAHANRDVPFELLVKELHLERAPGQSPLFQVSLTLDPPSPLSSSEWTLTRMATGTGASKFDLSLELAEWQEELAGHLEYSTDLFEETTIARLAKHWQILLAGMVADATRPVGELPLLTEREREQMLFAWNDTRASYPKERCLHQLFTEQAARVPDAIAATFEETSLTYQELNARANQFAHYLQTLGVRPDVLVAICVERSLEMLVGLLGILKAGGAYVPLDPAYPAERVAFMLTDTGVSILVTQQSLVAQLPSHSARVICLDADAERFSALSQANPVTQLTPEHLCYVIYTSGSTGRPKGVQIPHRAVVNFLLSMQREPGLTTRDTLLAVSTLSFDIAGLELYLPLLTGAHLVIVSQDVATNGTALAASLERSNVTMMQATPITWRILLASGWPGKRNLKALCGAEALPVELARELLPRVGSLYNMYGPTETTVWSTLCKIEATDSAISIGRPIANTSIAILDQHFQPVPLGVSGELYIGGDGLARGYLNRPELTRERFLLLSRSENVQERFYRTGDLARYRSNGSIELIGRADYQVKLRGFRIELGEIEAVLEQHPTVQQAVALVREDTPDDRRLVAYILPREQQTITADILRQHASVHLPNYMIPSALVMLEKFPQTPNGKVDRRSLPAPALERPGVGGTFIAPRSALEEVIASSWSRALAIEQVGVHDNFFALGGHSLLALQVTSELRTTLQLELSLRNFFEAPTVAQLAELATRLKVQGAEFSQPALRPQSRAKQVQTGMALPASFGQQGIWFLQQLDPQNTAYNIFVNIRLHRLLDVAALERSLNALVERHEALRTTFAMSEGQ